MFLYNTLLFSHFANYFLIFHLNKCLTSSFKLKFWIQNSEFEEKKRFQITLEYQTILKWPSLNSSTLARSKLGKRRRKVE